MASALLVISLVWWFKFLTHNKNYSYCDRALADRRKQKGVQFEAFYDHFCVYVFGIFEPPWTYISVLVTP